MIYITEYYIQSIYIFFPSITVKFKVDCPRLVPAMWRARSFPTC